MFYRKRQLMYAKKVENSVIPITLRLFDLSDITYGMSNFYPYYSTEALAVRVDDVTKYVPLTTRKPNAYDLAIKELSVRHCDNKTYYAYKPDGKIGFVCTDSIRGEGDYGHYITKEWTRRITEVRVSFAMSNSFDLFVSSNSGSTWTSIGTIPAGSHGITYEEPIEVTYTATGDEPDVVPTLPNGTFRFKIRSKLRTQPNTANIRFTACTFAGVVIGTYVSVNLDHALTKGRLQFENEWVGVVPPWNVAATASILEEGDIYGNSPALGDATIGALFANLKVNYIVNGNTYNICTYTYIPTLTIGIITEKTVSFDEWLNDPFDILQIIDEFKEGEGLKGIGNIPYQYW